MSNLVVAFAGPDQVGKTTAALHLQALGFAKYSMAGPAKEIAKIAGGFERGRKEVAGVYQYLLDNLWHGLDQMWRGILTTNKLVVVDDLRRHRDLDLISSINRNILLFIVSKEGAEPSTINHLDEWKNIGGRDVLQLVHISNNGTEEEFVQEVLKYVINLIAWKGLKD